MARPALPRRVFDFEDAHLHVPSEAVLDTCFVIAALNGAEPFHRQAVDYLQRLTDSESLLVHNRLLEVELVEVAFKLAVKEHHGRKAWPAMREDGRVRRRAGRLTEALLTSWQEVIATRPSLCVELGEVSADVPEAMRKWGLASYDAVHALTAIYAGSSNLVTLDAGFGRVPDKDLTLFVDSTRVKACRRRRGGR